MGNILTRTITQPKLQETSSVSLFKCAFNSSNNLNITNCSKNNYRNEVVQTLSRRIGAPLYIPLIAVIISFLLIYKKEKKYSLFSLSFAILILAEVLLKYTGFSLGAAISYYILPIIISIVFYVYLVKKIITEKMA